MTAIQLSSFFISLQKRFLHTFRDSIENRSITETSSVSRKHLRKPDKKYECAGRKGK